MASSNQHIIQKQIVRLNVPVREQAYDMQTQFLEVLKEKVMPQVEVELDKLSQEGKVIQIDQLRLDLGEISSERLSGDLPNMLLSKFRDEIHRLVVGLDAGIDVTGVKVVRQNESELDHLDHFLRTGTVNWQVKSAAFRPVEILMHLLEDAPKSLRGLLMRSTSAKIRRRLVQQFPVSLVERVIALLDPNWADFQRVLNIGIDDFSRRYPELLPQSLETKREGLFFQLSLAMARALPGKENGILKDIWPELKPGLKSTLQSEPNSQQKRYKTLLLAYLLKATYTNGRAMNQAISRISLDKIPVLLEGIGVFSRKEVTGALQKLLKEMRMAELPQRAEGVIQEWAAEAIVGGGVFSETESAAVEMLLEMQNSQIELPEEIQLRYRKPMEDLKPKVKQKKKAEKPSEVDSEESLPEELYVDNAGLVLLNPFIPHCFEGLGWFQAGEFTGETQRENGLMMLRYLSHGSEEPIGEHELVLNKLMVGLDADAPIRSDLGLTQEEMTEGETLLKSAIAYWDKLGEVDFEQFRETFLRREGRLIWEGSGWNLKVDRQTYDVLLKFLPWSYGIVKFPWMEKIITVDW